MRILGWWSPVIKLKNCFKTKMTFDFAKSPLTRITKHLRLNTKQNAWSWALLKATWHLKKYLSTITQSLSMNSIERVYKTSGWKSTSLKTQCRQGYEKWGYIAGAAYSVQPTSIFKTALGRFVAFDGMPEIGPFFAFCKFCANYPLHLKLLDTKYHISLPIENISNSVMLSWLLFLESLFIQK